MERVVLVHGSVLGGRATWSAQRRALHGPADLVVLDRPGFPPNPPVERVDFVEHAAWVLDRLEPGDHLVGHSYGGVIALLAAARAPQLGSLTVIEPPCTRVAGEDPDVADFALRGAAWWANGPTDDPEAFLRGFLQVVGTTFDPPSPLTPEVMQGARTLIVERGPWEADIPLAEIAATGLPALVVSGGEHPAFTAICEAIAAGLRCEHLVLTGYGHAAHQHPSFNDALLAHVERAAAS